MELDNIRKRKKGSKTIAEDRFVTIILLRHKAKVKRLEIIRKKIEKDGQTQIKCKHMKEKDKNNMRKVTPNIIIIDEEKISSRDPETHRVLYIIIRQDHIYSPHNI